MTVLVDFLSEYSPNPEFGCLSKSTLASDCSDINNQKFPVVGSKEGSRRPRFWSTSGFLEEVYQRVTDLIKWWFDHKYLTCVREANEK